MPELAIREAGTVRFPMVAHAASWFLAAPPDLRWLMFAGIGWNVPNPADVFPTVSPGLGFWGDCADGGQLFEIIGLPGGI